MARAPDEGPAPKRKALPKSTTRMAKSVEELPPDLLQRLQQTPRRALSPQEEKTFRAPQQFFQTAPAPSAVSSEPTAPLSGLFQKKPLTVQVVPEQRPVMIAQTNEEAMASMMAPSGWQTELSNPQVVQNVADQYNVRAKLGRRDQARMDREAADQKETPTALTQKQWDALTPLQQAGVQANADLMAAIARDFKTQSQHDNSGPAGDKRFKAYQDRSNELFGEDGSVGFKGLEYAPNTIAFLDKRGLGPADIGGRTLDDLISGDTLVDMDTIQHLGDEVKGQDTLNPWPADPRQKNIALAQRLATGQLEYQEKLAVELKKGKTLLTDITGRDTSQAAHTAYGAKGMESRVKLDAVRPETAALMDTYLEALARSDSPIDKALEAISGDLATRGASDKETAQVFEGLVERSRQASQGQLPWFDKIDFPMRPPDEVANALGAPTLKRAVTQVVK